MRSSAYDTIVRCETALIGKRVDGARSSHDLPSRVGDDATAEMPLRYGHIAPVGRATLQLGPVWRNRNRRECRRSAGFDNQNTANGLRQSVRQYAPCTRGCGGAP